ncbi:MAG: metallophosphoesterase [Acidobacteria bacterium]|nr:metallophosphoesterase [Acidobacteriota bacterium]
MSLGRACLLVAVAAVAAVPAVSAQRGESGRVVAVGDVHGSLDGLRSVLRAAGLIDASDRWTGGTATLVQTGDVTDRGADVRGALDLLMTLEREAPAQGGRVLPLLGNHEAMNLVGELRDASADICARFAGKDADKVRDDAWREYDKLVKARARSRKGEQPLGLTRAEDGFAASYPRGCIEYRLALGPEGVYGKWLRQRPIAARVGRSVFMHAGAPPDTTDSVETLNARARDEIARVDRFVARLTAAGLAAPWFRLEDLLAVAAAEVRWVNALVEAAKENGETPNLAGVDLALVKEAAAFTGLGDWSLLDGDGPLWYRGYALAEEAALDAPFTALLARWNADRLVVGHTVNRDFKVRQRLGGRLYLIDTGMLTPVYKGTGAALDFDGAGVSVFYGDGRRDVLTASPR